MLTTLLARWLAKRSKHVYISTACQHGRHGYCNAPTVTREGEWAIAGPSYCSEPGEDKKPAECKFCEAKCICRCHG